MTAQSTDLNTDVNGVKTSSEYGDRGDGTSTWMQYMRTADGGQVTIGAKADTAVLDGTSSSSVIAALKGLIRLARVSTSSLAVSAIGNASGNVANAIATATLVSAASKTAWLTKVVVTGAGATAASVVSVTITGLVGGTRTYTVTVPAGATTAIAPLILDFGDGIPASATNTVITVSVPAFGAGNTNVSVNVEGYVR